MGRLWVQYSYIQCYTYCTSYCTWPGVDCTCRFRTMQYKPPTIFQLVIFILVCVENAYLIYRHRYTGTYVQVLYSYIYILLASIARVDFARCSTSLLLFFNLSVLCLTFVWECLVYVTRSILRQCECTALYSTCTLRFTVRTYSYSTGTYVLYRYVLHQYLANITVHLQR